MLHYVGVIAAEFASLPRPWLGSQDQKMAPGFNRLSFSGGQVLLTLCVGELKSMLQAQNFAADSIFLSRAESSAWDDWTIQALLRCCRRGTELTAHTLATPVLELLTRHGFEIEPGGATALVRARFNPRWQIQMTRRQLNIHGAPASHCVVIGAGLAGASTAASLARRGWQVLVLDSAASPASAASALPVGLLAVPAASDGDVRSQLLRAGARLTIEQAREHLTSGQDWAQSGLMSAKPGRAAHWEPAAAWIKPHRLVQAWLAQPRIRFRGDAQVVSMEQSGGEWILRDAQGAVLAQASLVVLACAAGAQTLAGALNILLRQPMAGVHGQVSWAVQQEGDRSDLPAFPVNGLGHLLPDIPVNAGHAWFAGATYAAMAPPDSTEPSVSNGHLSNLSKLHKLHPPSARLMERRIHDGAIQSWQGIRFTTQDRMPLVGRLAHNPSQGGAAMLYINSGFGSRGLSWCVLCAELLAAHIGNEPLAMPDVQARLLRSGQ